MLSESFGQDFSRAGLPPEARMSAKYAQRRVASAFHCTDVCAGPSFFTSTVTWQNLQSTDTSPDVR